jgi:capsid protein
MSYPCVRTRIANDSDFPTAFVRAAFNFCLPAGVTKIDVVFLEPVATGTGESSGQCWPNGVERNNFQRPFIYVAVSKADRFPSPRSALRGKRIISLSHTLLLAKRWQFIY